MTAAGFLDALYAPQAWLLGLSPYISMSVTGVLVTALLALAGVILARLGHKPLWALVLLVPTVSIIGLWALAYLPFPREKRN